MVIYHRCIGSIASVCWDHRVNNPVIRHRVLDKDCKSVDVVVNLHKVGWLGYVSRMLINKLTQFAMTADVGVDWEKRNGQIKA